MLAKSGCRRTGYVVVAVTDEGEGRAAYQIGHTFAHKDAARRALQAVVEAHGANAGRPIDEHSVDEQGNVASKATVH